MYLRFLNYSNSTLIQYEKVNNRYFYSEYSEHMSIGIGRADICITEHKIRQMFQIIVLMNR